MVPLVCIGAVVVSGVVNPARSDSTFEWCDCGKGIHNVSVWPAGNKSRALKVTPGGAPRWLDFGVPTAEVGWRCDGMDSDEKTSFKHPVSYWSVQHSVQRKGVPCGDASGRLKIVGWQRAAYPTSVVYSSGESGYACIKIPVLLRTASGTGVRVG